MQHQHRPPKWAVAGLIIIGLLIIGSAIQSSAWTQGYTMGLLTGSADSAELAPYLLYRTGQGSLLGGGFFGGILRIGFLLLLALGVFKLIGFAHWHKHGGSPPWWRRHGPPPTEPVEPGNGPESDTAQAGKDAPQPPAPVNG